MLSLGRAILALLTGIAIVMLPIAGGIALSTPDTPSSSKLAISAPDCCDHDGMPADNMMKDCQAAAGCASKCFSLYHIYVSSPTTHPPVTGADTLLVACSFRSQEGSTPFRPPRA